ncbi:hypothetical protein BHE74_00051198 [Ensete ventricosum]|nr:hypothetical protein GW17_00017142 [Ensete ventricosum]RWW43173.1 hypothetical protein BHE74_00051198 [Ensete ventricosum]
MIGHLTLTDLPSSFHPFLSSSPAAAATAGPIPHSSPSSLVFVGRGTRPLRFASGLNQPKGSTRNRAAMATRTGTESSLEIARGFANLPLLTLIDTNQNIKPPLQPLTYNDPVRALRWP